MDCCGRWTFLALLCAVGAALAACDQSPEQIVLGTPFVEEIVAADDAAATQGEPANGLPAASADAVGLDHVPTSGDSLPPVDSDGAASSDAQQADAVARGDELDAQNPKAEVAVDVEDENPEDAASDSDSGCTAAAPCTDNNACTTGDKCSNGACLPGSPITCDDINPCTTDSCDSAKGCVHTANSNSCNDGSACTQKDACIAGACSGSLVSCDDKNVCTIDSCEPVSGCKHTPGSASACDDGNACTTGDSCANGKCAGVGKDCNDNNPCTTDSCAKDICSYSFASGPCSDGDSCTGVDLCAGGKCVPGAVVACDDGNPCTDDTCNKSTGCKSAFNAVGCTDGNACTAGDKCSNGACMPGSPVNCDDSNPCTSDNCSTTGSCTYVAIQASPCNDGNGCTVSDKCVNGVCSGVGQACDDGNICTNDSCANGKCNHINNTAKCTDADACTADDQCGSGKCNPGAKANCDDKDACTADSCDPTIGCMHKPSCPTAIFSETFPCDKTLAWSQEGSGWTSQKVGGQTQDCAMNFAVDGNSGSLTSQVIALPATAIALLSVTAHCKVVNQAGGTSYSPLYHVGGTCNVEVSADGFKSTITKFALPALAASTSTFSLASYKGKSIQLRLTASGGSWGYNYLWVDTVTIAAASSGAGPAACSKDADCGDGLECTAEFCDKASGTCINGLGAGAKSCSAASCDESYECAGPSCIPIVGSAIIGSVCGKTDCATYTCIKVCWSGTGMKPCEPNSTQPGKLVCSGPDSTPTKFGQAKHIADAASNLKCYDKDPCTTDVCDKGVCSFPAIPEGGLCEGMMVGTAVEKCVAGQCVPAY